MCKEDGMYVEKFFKWWGEKLMLGKILYSVFGYCNCNANSEVVCNSCSIEEAWVGYGVRIDFTYYNPSRRFRICRCKVCGRKWHMEIENDSEI